MDSASSRPASLASLIDADPLRRPSRRKAVHQLLQQIAQTEWGEDLMGLTRFRWQPLAGASS